MNESKSSVLWPAELRKKREGWGWLFGAGPVGLYRTLRLVHKITRVNLLLYLKFCIIWSRNRTKRPILGPNIGQSVKVFLQFFLKNPDFFRGSHGITQGKIERKFLRKSRFFPQEPRSFVAKGVEIVKCTQINVVEEFQRMSFFSAINRSFAQGSSKVRISAERICGTKKIHQMVLCGLFGMFLNLRGKRDTF